MARVLLILYSLVFVMQVSAQVSSDVHTYRGNQSFEKGDFDDASYHYLKTLQGKSEDFRAQYNLGNTLYKKNQYSDAVSTYQKALKNAKTKEQKTATLYNLGNAYFKNKQQKEAVDSYKQALKLDPNNQTILKNLQIALQKKDSKQQQQEQDQQQSQQQRNNEQNKGGKENPMDMYAPENDKFRKERQDHQQQEDNSNKEEPNQPKELEKELLQYIEERERHTAKRALGKQGYAQPQSNRKDW
ncbi:MAG: tetratricopeptide repeat protein [Flavobacteriaceae bacterium]|jgi:batC